MPIVLTDTTTIEEYAPEPGVCIRCRRANADAVVRVLRKETMALNGQIDDEAIDVTLLAKHIIGWEGVVDAEGRAIPWPGGDAPSEADMQLRTELVRHLPWNVLLAVRERVFMTYVAARDSGKA